MQETHQNLQRWYTKRKNVVARREYWQPKLDQIAAAGREYFESGGFEPDPVTGEPVFTVESKPINGFFHKVLQVRALIGATLTIGVPLDAENLVLRVSDAPFTASDLYDNDHATELRGTQPPLEGELVFPTGPSNQMPRSLSYVFGSFVDRAFGGP